LKQVEADCFVHDVIISYAFSPDKPGKFDFLGMDDDGNIFGCLMGATPKTHLPGLRDIPEIRKYR